MDQTHDKSIEIPEYIKDLIKSGTEIDEIRLDKNGKWFHNREPFTNSRIIDFFNKSIAITSDGQYVLHYDIYTYPIIVEDVPVFVTGVRFEGQDKFEKIFMNLSTGTSEQLNTETLIYRNNTLYCTLNSNSFPAKFNRSPSFHILDRLEEKNGEYFLDICGKRINLKQEAQQ